MGCGADITCRANQSDPCLRNAICMKMRDSPFWHVGTARLFRGSVFLLALALGSEATPLAGPMLPRTGLPAPPPARSNSERDASSPYLLAVGPPPLRFAQALPPPDLSTCPSPAAPPLPAVAEEIASTNAASARSFAAVRGGEIAKPDQRQAMSAEAAREAPSKAPEKKETPALLPDDTQREIRPEEILPYFQFPGSGGGTIVVPANSPSPESTRLPVSSAVYREH